MKASKLKSEAESSQGTSKPRRLKQKRTSRDRGGSDASKGVSECQIFPLYEGVKPNMPSRKLPKASSAVPQSTRGRFRLTDRRISEYVSPSVAATKKMIHHEQAELALNFYEKNQDDKFEIVEALHSNGTFVHHPNYYIQRLWIHISFTAKSKNDGSTKHFFGEIYEDERSGELYAAYCDTFEPSDDPGFKHGCVFCPTQLKCHPADGYLVGRPPWYVPYMRFV